jgi:hypothetical protein
MRCEDAIETLRSSEAADTLRRRAARAHAEGCAECTAAARALTALHAEQYSPVPPLPRQSFARALERASRAPERQPARGRGFWLGTVVGGALAAGIAVAVAGLWPQPSAGPIGNPAVLLALNEVREVSMSLESPEALVGAEIRILLTGGVGLQGFAGQRELRWLTDLDRGINQLTLPLVGLDASGGQVTVEVQHGAKLRTFVIDVQTTGHPTASPGEAV